MANYKISTFDSFYYNEQIVGQRMEKGRCDNITSCDTETQNYELTKKNKQSKYQKAFE